MVAEIAEQVRRARAKYVEELVEALLENFFPQVRWDGK